MAEDKLVTAQKTLSAATTEHAKFSAGNKAAGTRARKHLMELTRICKELRADIQAQK